MMLGKRSRPPMQRTSSMTEFTLDLSGGGGVGGIYQPSDPHSPFYGGGSGGLDQRYLASAGVASPRPQRRNSADYETAHFLRVCSLCNRRLIPGHDIYMYRGDTAFCSLECRHQQMTQDERKEKRSMSASKKDTASAAAGTKVSAAGETVSAV